ncbi:hypothetical protein KZ829_22160 [Actinoplanes hulinensis]|uniref:Uncharacterized protein n=1 Tax=Actinoplanes hulinensis TaxID=1144547 RepID=A0ABS7B7L7_9ACTN|nr:hypothetical protein [Actinoplanes hulinensis]MBW6436449.1 hypothetical protein [Actinoplanes hulinensis]
MTTASEGKTVFGNRQQFEAIEKIAKLIDQIDRRVERIETVTLVREPGTAAAAEAYEGLRKQVVAAVQNRTSHLAQLAQIDAAVAHGAAAEDLAELLGRCFEQAGLEKVDDADDPEHTRYFKFVGDRDSGRPEVIEAAYVDRATGRAVRLGVAKYVGHRSPQDEGEEKTE